jgi:hypothetical protein
MMNAFGMAFLRPASSTKMLGDLPPMRDGAATMKRVTLELDRSFDGGRAGKGNIGQVGIPHEFLSDDISRPCRHTAPSALWLFDFVLLFRDPVPDVSRAMEQRHAILLTASQEANSLQINQHEFVQIEGYRRSAFVDQHFQTLQMLQLHSAYKANRCSLTIAVFFDLPSHLRPIRNPETRGCNLKTTRNRLNYQLAPSASG